MKFFNIDIRHLKRLVIPFWTTNSPTKYITKHGNNNILQIPIGMVQKEEGDKIGVGYRKAWLTNWFEHADTPDPSHNPYYVIAWCATHMYSWLLSSIMSFLVFQAVIFDYCNGEGYLGNKGIVWWDQVCQRAHICPLTMLHVSHYIIYLSCLLLFSYISSLYASFLNSQDF